MRLLAYALLMLASCAAAQALPVAPAWLASGPDGVYALTTDGRVFVTDGRTARQVAAGLSPHAPLQACAGRVLGVTRKGELQTVSPRGPAVSREAELSTVAGLACDGPDVIAIGADGSAVRLAERDGAWRVSARADVNALPDARPTTLRVSDAPAVAVLAGPSRRYVHGVLGDDVEASSLLLLDARTLKVQSRLDLPAPLVFEDLTARPVTLPDRTAVLILVRAGPEGGGQLVVADVAGGDLRTRAVGPDFGRPGRWLDPLVGQREVYAVHTPHIGGALHRYELQGAQLTVTRLTDGVSTHAIGSRLLGAGLVLSPGVLVLPTQDRRTLLRLQCHDTCSVTGRHALNAPLSTNVVLHRGTVVAGDTSGNVHFLP